MSEDETCAAKMNSNNLYKYFNRYRGYMKMVMNQHEIDKAILNVIGERQFDKRIRKMWDRVLKEKAGV